MRLPSMNESIFYNKSKLRSNPTPKLRYRFPDTENTISYFPIINH